MRSVIAPVDAQHEASASRAAWVYRSRTCWWISSVVARAMSASFPRRDTASKHVVDAGEAMCRQPQPKQMATATNIGVVLIRLESVKALGVGDQLDVTGLKIHRQVDTRIIRHGLDEFQCLGLRLGEPG